MYIVPPPRTVASGGEEKVHGGKECSCLQVILQLSFCFFFGLNVRDVFSEDFGVKGECSLNLYVAQGTVEKD